jgi:hypothetical protein
MGVLVKRKEVPIVSIQPEVLVPTIRREKINWDPYYQKCKNGRKEKQKMAIVKKVGVIKKEEVVNKGKTIDDLWVEVLSAAVGKRFTDTALAIQISERATKLTGKKHTYNEASVAGHRSGYNCGKFPVQKGIKPTVRLKKFESPMKEK